MKRFLFLMVVTAGILFLVSGNTFAQEKGDDTAQEGVEDVEMKAAETQDKTTTPDVEPTEKAVETPTETTTQDTEPTEKEMEAPLKAATQDKDAKGVEVAEIFSWYPDWIKGLLYALMGIIGALTTMFSLIGGAVPGTAGYLPLQTRMTMVAEWENILDGLIKETNRNPEEIETIGKEANRLRDDVRSSQWSQYRIASVQYIFLGGAFAAMLATNLLQALVIGAGWTAFLGSLGLKKDYAERKVQKDESTQELLKKVKELEKQLKKADSDKETSQKEKIEEIIKSLGPVRMAAKRSMAL